MQKANRPRAFPIMTTILDVVMSDRVWRSHEVRWNREDSLCEPGVEHLDEELLIMETCNPSCLVSPALKADLIQNVWLCLPSFLFVSQPSCLPVLCTGEPCGLIEKNLAVETSRVSEPNLVKCTVSQRRTCLPSLA